MPFYLKTRNIVSNAHKMIPPAPPWFVWQTPCFALGNPKIIQIKFKIEGAVWHHVVNNSLKFHEILFSGLRGVAD